MSSQDTYFCYYDYNKDNPSVNTKVCPNLDIPWNLIRFLVHGGVFVASLP